jgi:histidine triad (HIT) family protein
VSNVDCVFCKIASGEIPALRLLDADDCLAFLDVAPLSPGHCLLIPRRHYDDILRAPPGIVSSLASALPLLASAVMRASGATGLNILQNTGASSGQAVFHLHFHLIPRREGDGLGFRWNAKKYAAGEAELVQSRILSELEMK